VQGKSALPQKQQARRIVGSRPFTTAAAGRRFDVAVIFVIPRFGPRFSVPMVPCSPDSGSAEIEAFFSNVEPLITATETATETVTLSNTKPDEHY
jgi:hypothetical protein